MEIHLVLMDCKTQYCSDINPMQSDLQIQCSPYQNSNNFLCRNKKIPP